MFEDFLMLFQGDQEFGQVLIALDAPEVLLGHQQRRGSPAHHHLRTRQRLPRRVQLAVRAKQLSIRLVEERLRRSCSLRPNRWKVSVSSSPSSRLRTALGLIPSTVERDLNEWDAPDLLRTDALP